MKFIETPLRGAFEIELQRHSDDRGFFARSWCENEFRNNGLNPTVRQCNVSFNERAGTLRGMHYQASPHEEAKLVRCTRGEIFDVIIDLRPDSPTYKKSFSAKLTQENRKMLYIPEGFAHGFQTLVDNTEVFYQMSEFYSPEYGRGLRWNDPVFDIQWPDAATRYLSERDSSYPDFSD